MQCELPHMNVLVVANGESGKASDSSFMLQSYLSAQGVACCVVDSQTLPGSVALDAEGHPLFDHCAEWGFGGSVDLAVALGGDGTILRTARAVCGTPAPVLGINFGHLGFLANPTDAGVVPMVAAALAGDVVEERRTNLRIDVECEGDDCEPIERPRSYFALNEVTVSRGASGRIVDFSVGISGDHVASMRGDGLVVSTATGSTAYALSAGGPLVAPGFRGLVVVPIAVHTLRSRTLVTEHHDVVEVELTGDDGRRDATLFADGEALVFERPVKRVVVRAGQRPTTFLRYRRESFYTQVSRVFF